jgi:Carboxypeptidase regulatory-like domain
MAMKWLLTALLCGLSSLSFAAGTQSALTGRIVDSNGRPVAHATVLVYHAGVKVGYSTYCPSCYRDCGKRVTTDKNGAFSIQGLDPDLWFTLLAVHDGYVPTISSKFDPDKNIEVKITLASRSASSLKTSIAKGRVTDSAGTPIQDVVVEPVGLIVGDGSTYGTIEGLDPLAATNVKGEFELSYLGTSPAMLVSIEGRGFAPRFAKLTTGTSRATLVVSEGATIHGILTANGKPVGDAEVGLIAKDRGVYANDLTIFGHPYEEQRIGTAPDGSFLISNVPEPVTWLLYGKMGTMPKGEGTKPLEIITSHERQYLDKVHLEADPTHVVAGKVSLSDGHPIPEGMRLTFASGTVWDSQVVMLSKDGSFHIGNVPDGDFCIFPSVKGYETKSVPNSDCDVPVNVAGKDMRGIHVVVYPMRARP